MKVLTSLTRSQEQLGLEPEFPRDASVVDVVANRVVNAAVAKRGLKCLDARNLGDSRNIEKRPTGFPLWLGPVYCLTSQITSWIGRFLFKWKGLLLLLCQWFAQTHVYKPDCSLMILRSVGIGQATCRNSPSVNRVLLVIMHHP